MSYDLWHSTSFSVSWASMGGCNAPRAPWDPRRSSLQPRHAEPGKLWYSHSTAKSLPVKFGMKIQVPISVSAHRSSWLWTYTTSPSSSRWVWTPRPRSLPSHHHIPLQETDSSNYLFDKDIQGEGCSLPGAAGADHRHGRGGLIGKVLNAWWCRVSRVLSLAFDGDKRWSPSLITVKPA